MSLLVSSMCGKVSLIVTSLFCGSEVVGGCSWVACPMVAIWCFMARTIWSFIDPLEVWLWCFGTQMWSFEDVVSPFGMVSVVEGCFSKGDDVWVVFGDEVGHVNSCCPQPSLCGVVHESDWVLN